MKEEKKKKKKGKKKKKRENGIISRVALALVYGRREAYVLFVDSYDLELFNTALTFPFFVM